MSVKVTEKESEENKREYFKKANEYLCILLDTLRLMYIGMYIIAFIILYMCTGTYVPIYVHTFIW